MKNWIFFLLFIISFSTFSQGIEYDTFLPKNLNKDTAVYVLLHGCKQIPKDILEDTGFKKYAQEKNFAIITPKQNPFLNWDKCWNWFFPINQMNAFGSEISAIMYYVNSLKTLHGLRNNPTYVMGFSSGGAQAVNLFACFPEEFEGLAVHSGIAYGAAQDVFQATTVIEKGPLVGNQTLVKRINNCSSGFDWADKRVLLFQGKADTRVVPGNFNALKSQILGLFDLQDDGKVNNSNLVSIDETKVSKPLKYDYDYGYYEFAEGNSLETYLVDDMAHDWGGGSVRVNRNDPKGPETTQIIIDTFF